MSCWYVCDLDWLQSPRSTRRHAQANSLLAASTDSNIKADLAGGPSEEFNYLRTQGGIKTTDSRPRCAAAASPREAEEPD